MWGSLVVPSKDLLILEVRNEARHEVRFSAFNYARNEFLWKDILFEETWWIGLTAVTPDILLLHQYHGMENPDDKGLIAFDINQQKILWQYDHFSFACLHNDKIKGHFLSETATPVMVDSHTGQIFENIDFVPVPSENICITKPFQYTAGEANFETVKSFLARKMDVKLVAGAEYLEYSSLIFISYYVQQDSLANYLVVIREDGVVVANEKLDDQLKGLGLETFFILAGCLIFVRNKRELVSFRIV